MLDKEVGAMMWKITSLCNKLVHSIDVHRRPYKSPRHKNAMCTTYLCGLWTVLAAIRPVRRASRDCNMLLTIYVFKGKVLLVLCLKYRPYLGYRRPPPIEKSEL